MAILEHFGEDAHGRDGHGHASKSKETLYILSYLDVSRNAVNPLITTPYIILNVNNILCITLYHFLIPIYFNLHFNKHYRI
jgi:hypothetical protein